MDRFLQTLMDGLAVGSLYALIALGYTMVYGILKFINFAHSDVFVLGAWVSFSIALTAGFGNTNPVTGEVMMTSIAPWVWWVAGSVSAIAVLLTLYERLIQPRLPGLPRSGAAVPMSVAACWGWSLIMLVVLARAAKMSDTFSFLAGGIILITAMGTCGLVGFSLERLAYKPLRKAPRLNVLITAIGVSLFLQNLGQLDWMFGTRPQGMPELLQDRVLNRSVIGEGPLTLTENGATVVLDQPVNLAAGRDYKVEVFGPSGRIANAGIASPVGEYAAGSSIAISPPVTTGATDLSYKLVRSPRVPIRLVDVAGAGTAVVLMLLLDWLVFRTKLGRAMRAVSFSPGNAAIMGINVDRVISITFVIGASLAAAAGFLYSQKYSGLGQTASPTWVLLGLKAFVAAVVGGIGNIRGAMLGGILIGLIEFFSRAYLGEQGPKLCDVVVFGLLIVVLLVRPGGLLGSVATEKV
jgi:branched-subunit amino acid ABC-type transport system permease component